MNTPQDSNYRQTAQGRTSGPSGAGGSVADTAEELARQARSQGQEQVQHYREVAADKVDALADSVKAAASELHDDDVGHLSQHIADMAGGLRSLSDGLREKSADQILRDVKRVARENPTLFIAGSIALGFGITRFARASASSGIETRRDRLASGASTIRRTDASATDPAVPGTTATPFESERNTTATGHSAVLSGAPGPSAGANDAIAARTGTTASGDSTVGSARIGTTSTENFNGRSEP